MKASDLFIKCLEEEGVEYIFGMPGEETSDLMISLLDLLKSTEEFPRVLKKAKESTHVPVIVSIDVDYSRNRILLDDNYRG